MSCCWFNQTVITLDSTVAAGRDQLSSAVEEDAVILGLKDGIYYGLNPVGARVWQLIQDPRPVREVCEAIESEYEVERERCERDVIALLERLAESNLIEVRGGAA